MDKAKEVVGVTFISGNQSAVVLEPCIEPLHFPSPPIPAQWSPILRPRSPSVSPMRRDEHDMPFPEFRIMRITVVGAVSDKEMRDAAGESRVNRGFGKRDLMRRGGSDLDGNRQARIFANRHYLRAFSAFCLPDACPPFLALAKVPSM